MGNSCARSSGVLTAVEPSSRRSPFPREFPLIHSLSQAEADCPMLRSLLADSDAQAHLTTFMQLTSLAQLHNTCTLWRRWLVLPQQSGRRLAHHSVNYSSAASLSDMAQCDWLLRLVTELTMEPPTSPADRPCEIEPTPDQQRRELVWLLQSLPRFHRLDSLQLRPAELCLPSPQQLHDLLLPFAVRLRSLTVQPLNPSCIDALRAICVHLSLFVNLESLHLCAYPKPHQVIDLSALPQLKHLRTFAFDLYDQQVRADQATTFAKCRALTSLSFGAWGPRHNGNADNVDALTVFVNSRFPNEADDSASSALTPIATLTDFSFVHSQLTAAGWAQLSRLTALKTILYLSACDLGITKEGWSRLGKLTQLTELHLCSPNPLIDHFHASSPALNADHLWPPILQMTSLTELRVSRCNLQQEHITSLSALPVLQLTVLGQCHLRFEDLDIVAAACTPQRRIWLVGTSVGDKRTEVLNWMFPDDKQDRRW